MMQNFKALHLTDIHFKSQKKEGKTDATRRKKTLENLIRLLEENIEFVEDINVVIISGDIAFSGNIREYDDSKIFIDKLNEKVFKKKAKFIICAGNHDIRREAKKIIFEDGDLSEFARKISFDSEEILDKFDEFQYSGYIKFCEQIGIHPYKIYDKKSSFLTGYRICKKTKVCFLILNSSWLCNYHEKDDLGNIYLGKDILFLLTNQAKEEMGEEINDYLKISIIHHPPNWYHWSEKFDSSQQTSLDYINQFSDLVFCGHEHGDLKAPMVLSQNCFWIIGGATYAHKDLGFYDNNCSIVEIDRKYSMLKRHGIKFNGKKEQWFFDTEPYIYPMGIFIDGISKIYKHDKEKILKFMSYSEQNPINKLHDTPLNRNNPTNESVIIPKSFLKDKLKFAYGISSQIEQKEKGFFVCHEGKKAFIIITCSKFEEKAYPLKSIQNLIQEYLNRNNLEVWLILDNDDHLEIGDEHFLYAELNNYFYRHFEEPILKGELIIDKL